MKSTQSGRQYTPILRCLNLHKEEVHGKLIPGIRGYSITNTGEVWTFKQNKYPRILKANTGKDGYLRVRMVSTEGKKVTAMIHHLVARTYIGSRPDNKVVRHIDCNKTNNCISNLAYGTRKENTADSCINGDMSKVLSDITAMEIYNESICETISQKDIAAKFSIHQSTVSRIKTKKIWVHVNG